jgi:hypothetical protein
MRKATRFLRIIIATSIALIPILTALLLGACATKRPTICDPVHAGPEAATGRKEPHHTICDPVHPGPKPQSPDSSNQQK